MNTIDLMHDRIGSSHGTPLPYAVLIVDDDAPHRGLVKEILDDSMFDVSEACSGEEGLQWLEKKDFDCVLLDHRMPGISGLETCRRIRAKSSHELMPIIMVTGQGCASEALMFLRAGANDFLSKPYHPSELEVRVQSLARRKRMTDRLDDAETVLFTLAHMVEARDRVTGDHCARLSHLAARFAEKCRLGYAQRLALHRAAILHDIGKIAIPDAILLKEGPLDSKEWEIMKKHPVIGAEICNRLHSMKTTVEIIRHHHECWNGSGYPDGLAGERIPLLARLFQILDVYDALSHKRPYKEALSERNVLEIMQQEIERGRLDPVHGALFVDMIRTDDCSVEPKHRDHGLEIVESLRRAGMLANTRFYNDAGGSNVTGTA